MSNLIQLRRGTTAQRLAMILASGEPGWDTDLRQLFIGDGVTYGGYPLSPTVSFKNKLINGNFDFWQRGTSFSAAGYTADRWAVQFNAVTSPSALQGVFSAGDISGGVGARNYLSIGCSGNTDSTNHYMNVVQRIESVQTLAARTCTVSFRIFTSAARAISIGFNQAFGTGGSAAVSAIGAQKINLVSGWQTVTATINIPNISGKTIGTSNDCLVFVIWLTAGTSYDSQTAALGTQNGSVLISGIQIEDGNAATLLEQRPPGVELALCQRYYEKSYDPTTAPGTVTQAGNSVAVLSPLASAVWRPGTMVYFKVTKRASPTVTILSPATGVAGNARDFASGVDVAAAVNNTGCSAFLWIASNSAATTQYNLQTHWTADAEL